MAQDFRKVDMRKIDMRKVDPGTVGAAARAQRQGPWADFAIAVCAGSVALVAWVYLERTENLGLSALVFFLSFVVLGVLCSLSRRVGTGDALPSVDPSKSWRARLSPPRRGVWVAPVALFALMATTFPIAFRTRPGDTSIWPAAVAFVVVLGYGGLAVGMMLWAWLLSPLSAMTRVVLAWRRGHGFDAMVQGGLLLAGLLASIATYFVAWLYAPKRATTLRGPDIASADLFGSGSDWNAASLWVVRAAIVGGVLCVLGLVWMVARAARRGTTDN